MPVGILLSKTGTQLLCGTGSVPPRNVSVIPFWVCPCPLGACFTPTDVDGIMSPPAAKTKSRPPLLPGDTLARKPARSMWPSRPRSVGTQVPGLEM